MGTGHTVMMALMNAGSIMTLPSDVTCVHEVLMSAVNLQTRRAACYGRWVPFWGTGLGPEVGHGKGRGCPMQPSSDIACAGDIWGTEGGGRSSAKA